MKYIEKVILENFQSHKNTIVEFDNQLNVIIGPSDSGKTAILRGIKWALYNEPSGDYFIREGQTECSVTISFSDKTRIKRYRNKTKNIYYIYDSDNNETKFEGFGTNVPQEIIDKTGIKKILLDSNESKAINLSDQLEGAFLLSEKGSTRANSIGRLVGVNIIDDSLKETLKDSRNLSQNKKSIEENILKLEDELREYNYLLELSKTINQIEIIRNEIYNNGELLNEYKEKSKKIIDISKFKKEVMYYVERLKEIDSVDLMFNNISNNINKYKYFENKLSQFNKLKVNISESINVISLLRDIESGERIIGIIDKSYNKVIKLVELQQKIMKLKSESYELSNIKQRLIYLDDISDKLNNTINKIKQLEKVSNLKYRDSSLRKNLETGNRYIKRLENVDMVSDINISLQDKVELLNKLDLINKKIIINSNEIIRETKQVDKSKRSIYLNLENYKSLLLSQETCPLCFSNINDEKINHIIEHYN